MRLAVVDDPGLAEAVGLLSGEWKAQVGCRLVVEQMTEADLLSAGSPAADAVLCPSYLLGPLAERKLIAPLSEKLLQDGEERWSNVFELLRRREARWGSSIFAVPLGSPVLTCYYRPELLEKLGRKPPQTWIEYQELVELLSDRKALGELAPRDDRPWFGAIEPLGPGWAGLVLLARAAPYAKHPDNYSTLFNIRSMEPLVDSPPIARALEELVAAAGSGPPEQLGYGPAEVRAEFWRGRCGLALSWPTAAARLPDLAQKPVPCRLAELPGSTDVYNIDEQTWEIRSQQDDPRVPLLATGGRIGVLGSKSTHPAVATGLLVWLSGERFRRPPSVRSPATTLFCRSHKRSPKMWVESAISPAAARQYADVVQQTFQRPQWVFALRIPGRADYLDALDKAVHKAVRHEQSTREALQQAAARWREITTQLGVEAQRRAYLHSLELEP